MSGFDLSRDAYVRLAGLLRKCDSISSLLLHGPRQQCVDELGRLEESAAQVMADEPSFAARADVSSIAADKRVSDEAHSAIERLRSVVAEVRTRVASSDVRSEAIWQARARLAKDLFDEGVEPLRMGLLAMEAESGIGDELITFELFAGARPEESFRTAEDVGVFFTGFEVDDDAEDVSALLGEKPELTISASAADAQLSPMVAMLPALRRLLRALGVLSIEPISHLSLEEPSDASPSDVSVPPEALGAPNAGDPAEFPPAAGDSGHRSSWWDRND